MSVHVRYRESPQEPFVRARAILPAIGLGLLATLEGSGQVVIDMPTPKGKPVETGTVALNRYAGARDAPLYSYASPLVVWPWYWHGYGYGFGFPYYGFGYGYGYYRRFGGFSYASANSIRRR